MSDCKVLNNGDSYRNIRTNINENFETLERKIVEQSETRPPVVYLPYEVYLGLENKEPQKIYLCNDTGYMFNNNKMYGYTELVTVDALVRNGITFPCTTAEFIENCNSIGVDCYVYIIRADITDLPADRGILSCKISESGGPVCLEFIEDNNSERYIYINDFWGSIGVINDDSESVKSTWSSDKISKKIDSRIASQVEGLNSNINNIFKRPDAATGGYWVCDDDANNISDTGIGLTGASFVNVPDDKLGTLLSFVFNEAYRIQIVHIWNYNKIYIRACYGGNWTEWKNIVTSA